MYHCLNLNIGLGIVVSVPGLEMIPSRLGNDTCHKMYHRLYKVGPKVTIVISRGPSYNSTYFGVK